jgi:hypothetical protein
MKGRSDVMKMCWKMDVVTREGLNTLPFNCEYFGPTKVNEQNCAVDFSRSGIKDPPSGERQWQREHDQSFKL